MDTDERATAAELLRTAGANASPIPPLTMRWPQMSLEDAYAIQLRNVAERLNDGATIAGFKVGLTSTAMRIQLGVLEPDFGHVFDDMVLESGTDVRLDTLCAPRVEPEFALILDRAISGPGCSAQDVAEAIGQVRPALEIIDSRIAGWEISLSDTVADNASSGSIVLGSPMSGALDAVRGSDPAVVMSVDGVVLERGVSSAALGHPFTAAAWLANKLGEFGTSLLPGHVIMPGSCTRAVAAEAGSYVEARFEAVGDVAVAFRSSVGVAT